ncbi:MAG TPA: glutamate mutase L, partial [Oceanobacillus sp.]|nr:glutamate mutase L [Oceanobacillus sp.]
KSLRPATIPDSPRALYMEHAFLRAAIGTLLQASRPAWTPGYALDDPKAPLPAFRRIIGAGAALANTGRPGMSAMLLLDALQPSGVAQLQIDGHALIPAMGALARIIPEAVVQLLDAGGLENLCTSISISGRPRPNRKVAKVTISKENGETERHTIMGGTLFVYPLSIGLKATVRVSVRRGLHIGGKRKIKVEVEGGTAGLIIDARGRPLPLARDPKGLAAQLPEWYAQATGDPIREINLEWLEEAVLDTLSGGAISEQRRAQEPKRRGLRLRRGKKAQEETAESLIQEALADPEMTDVEQPKRKRRFGRRAANETAVREQTSDDIDDLRNLFS